MSPDFRLVIPADPAQVAGALAAFAEFEAAHALPAGVQRSFATALDELLANAISHGRAREVTLEAQLVGDRLRATITDDGKAFDPFAKASPDTTLSVMARPIGGLGIHLVMQMMDEVQYRRHGHQNIVTIEKRTGST